VSIISTIDEITWRFHMNIARITDDMAFWMIHMRIIDGSIHWSASLFGSALHKKKLHMISTQDALPVL
jgi:hypothetical protein